MRLGIISDAQHYRDEEGALYALTPLTRQFEQWAAIFDEVLILAPLLRGAAPGSHSPYRARNIELLPVENAGGNSLKAKLGLAMKTGGWWASLNKLLAAVDAVHIRCPNNISILGLLALARSACHRQAVYTGNWNGYEAEPATYRWQRWFLKRWFSGPVAVYGEWPHQPPHVIPSFSPSYSRADWEGESDAVRERLEKLTAAGAASGTVRLMTVGALDRNKNQQAVIRAVKLLNESGVRSELHILGDGVMRDSLTALAASLGLSGQVHFNGHTPHERVRDFYRRSDFVIQPSFTEGFSKVPAEALFHGAIPLLSDIPVNLQIIGHNSRGRSFRPADAEAIAAHVAELVRSPPEMARLIESGREYSLTLTLDAWREHLRGMMERHWGVRLAPRGAENGEGS